MGWVLFWEALKGSRWATRQGCLQGHCQLNGHEFEQAPVDGEGQGSLMYCSLWDLKKLAMTEQHIQMIKRLIGLQL